MAESADVPDVPAAQKMARGHRFLTMDGKALPTRPAPTGHRALKVWSVEEISTASQGQTTFEESRPKRRRSAKATSLWAGAADEVGNVFERS